jgi:hypothetical protein
MIEAAGQGSTARAAAMESVLTLCGVQSRRSAASREHMEFAMAQSAELAERRRRPRLPLPRAELAAVARLCDELREAVDALDEKLDKPIALWFWSSAASLGADGEDREFDLYEMSERLEALSDSCRNLSRPRLKKPAQRPPGTFQNPALRSLIFDLYVAIVKIGHGRLTLSQDLDWSARGTLPQTLEILRPWLPGVVPRRLPYSTLRRILHSAPRRDDGPPSPKLNQKAA